MDFIELYKMTNKKSFSEWIEDFYLNLEEIKNISISDEDKNKISNSINELNSVYEEMKSFSLEKFEEAILYEDIPFFSKGIRISFENLLTNNNFLTKNANIVNMKDFIPSNCYGLRLDTSEKIEEPGIFLEKYYNLVDTISPIVEVINKRNKLITEANKKIIKIENFLERTKYKYDKIKETVSDWDKTLYSMFLGNSEYTIGPYAFKELSSKNRNFAIFAYEIIRDLTGTSVSTVMCNKYICDTIKLEMLSKINKNIRIADGYIDLVDILDNYRFGKKRLPQTVKEFKEWKTKKKVSDLIEYVNSLDDVEKTYLVRWDIPVLDETTFIQTKELNKKVSIILPEGVIIKQGSFNDVKNIINVYIPIYSNIDKYAFNGSEVTIIYEGTISKWKSLNIDYTNVVCSDGVI